MALRVTVDEPREVGKAGLRKVHVSVYDDDFPNLVGEFGYLVARGWVALIAVGVQPRPALPEGVFDPLTISAVRDLPLSRWDAAARAHLAERPPVPPKPIGERRFRSLVHLQELAERFEAEQRKGTPDPAAAIAREDGVNRSTVRSWIHRARQAGLLPPLARRPNSKGEASE